MRSWTAHDAGIVRVLPVDDDHLLSVDVNKNAIIWDIKNYIRGSSANSSPNKTRSKVTTVYKMLTSESSNLKLQLTSAIPVRPDHF